MHRIDGPGSLPGNVFREGDPTLGVAATTVTADFMNAVQLELANVIEAAGLALSKPDNTQLRQALAILIASAVPPGAVQAFARSAAPAGWLLCNGGVVSRTTYAALFAAIGTAFNTGGEAGTVFRLPDLRGEFVRGWDAGRGVDPGRTFGSAQGWATGRPQSGPDYLGFVRRTEAGDNATSTNQDSLGSGTQPDILLTYAGDTETRPRNVALLYCIRF
ncbi:MAG: phage tail protein [Methylibium sp.]